MQYAAQNAEEDHPHAATHQIRVTALQFAAQNAQEDKKHFTIHEWWIQLMT